MAFHFRLFHPARVAVCCLRLLKLEIWAHYVNRCYRQGREQAWDKEQYKRINRKRRDSLKQGIKFCKKVKNKNSWELNKKRQYIVKFRWQIFFSKKKKNHQGKHLWDNFNSTKIKIIRPPFSKLLKKQTRLRCGCLFYWHIFIYQWALFKTQTHVLPHNS